MSRFALLSAMGALTLTAPALAQHAGHDAHTGHQMPQPEPVDPSPGPTMELPPPEEAGSGLPRAADAIWGAEAMRPSREALR
ncbi:MAG: copper resistance protein B, partial [Novosphingobium sp.]